MAEPTTITRWYTRPQEAIRLHAIRPAGLADQQHPGCLRVCLQRVVRKLVDAEHAKQMGWLLPDQVEQLARNLVDQGGWTPSTQAEAFAATAKGSVYRQVLPSPASPTLPEAPPAQTPEPDMPRPTPHDQLHGKVEAYKSALEALDPTDQKARQRCHQLRWDIKKLCDKAKLPMPELPEMPAKQDARPSRKKPEERAHRQAASCTVQLEAGFGPSQPLPAILEITVPKAVFRLDGERRGLDLASRIQLLLGEVTALLPDLFDTPSDERQALLLPLGNLDAMAHLAANFAATGRIEVA